MSKMSLKQAEITRISTYSNKSMQTLKNLFLFFKILHKLRGTNVIEVKTTEQKSLIKQQILLYKTAVYMLVKGGITHQKQQISKKVIVRGSTLTLGGSAVPVRVPVLLHVLINAINLAMSAAKLNPRHAVEQYVNVASAVDLKTS